MDIDCLFSLLLMTVEPDGPSYEIQLEAETIEMTSQRRSAPHGRHHALPLLSNRNVLAWGGVPLGRARQQSVKLKNASDQTVKLRIEVLTPKNEFQVTSL